MKEVTLEEAVERLNREHGTSFTDQVRELGIDKVVLPEDADTRAEEKQKRVR
jgi:hypothetical protein